MVLQAGRSSHKLASTTLRAPVRSWPRAPSGSLPRTRPSPLGRLHPVLSLQRGFARAQADVDSACTITTLGARGRSHRRARPRARARLWVTRVAERLVDLQQVARALRARRRFSSRSICNKRSTAALFGSPSATPQLAERVDDAEPTAGGLLQTDLGDGCDCSVASRATAPWPLRPRRSRRCWSGCR